MTNLVDNIPPKNIVLPWPQTIKDLKPFARRSLIEDGYSSVKNMVNRLMYGIPSDHASLGLKNPQDIKSVVLIGVHGWFPGKILKTGKLI